MHRSRDHRIYLSFFGQSQGQRLEESRALHDRLNVKRVWSGHTKCHTPIIRRPSLEVILFVLSAKNDFFWS